MTAEYRGEKEYTNFHFDNEDQLKPFDWGLNFGVGIEVVEHLQISCHYEMGLSNFCDRPVNEYKNRNFSVSLGWLF